MRARVAASSAAATAGAEPRPSRASAGSAARSTSSTRAPRAAARASAYATSTRDLELAAGLPDSPTTATLPTSLTPARSSGASRPASPWRRRGHAASLGNRDPTQPHPDSVRRCGGAAHLPERRRAAGSESGAARRGVVFRLERVRDVAAVLGRERDRGRIQPLAHPVGTAGQSADVGGVGGLYVFLISTLRPCHLC